MTLPVLAILLLGVWHGINPGMGWLFAVALGIQERDRRNVWRALLPLAAGHALAIAVALAVAALIGAFVSQTVLEWGVGMVLVGYGVILITRNRHPRYGGMRMGVRQLTVWSFVMASAHGAGIMVVPFVIADADSVVAVSNSSPMSAATLPLRSVPGGGADGGWRDGHARHLAGFGDTGPASGWIVLLAHTVGYLLATGLVAVTVYEKVGLRLLRTVWLNLDLIWGVALAATGIMAPFV